MYLLSGSFVSSPPSKPLASAEILAGNLTSSYHNIDVVIHCYNVDVVIHCYIVFTFGTRQQT